MSQWQRWRELRMQWNAEKGGVVRRPDFHWCWQPFDDDGEAVVLYKPWQGWRWGIWTEQMCAGIGLGPLRLYFDMR